MGRYEGRNVVITGASTGFGFTTAQVLADQGARVLITGRDEGALDAARAKLTPDAVAVRSDASVMADIDALADQARADFGTVDALFVNAGLSGGMPFEEMSERMYDELFAANTKGAYFTVQKLVPLLSPGSGVVLTTSAANVKGLPGTSVYAATKAALRSMTRTLARELLPRGIRVNAVSPGPIDTGILAKRMPKEAADRVKAQFIDTNPMRRLGEPAEVAAAMVFLAFEATYTTGAELAVDGGATQL